MGNNKYYVIILQSATQQMRLENALNDNEIEYKAIPIPRYLSNECGTCLRIKETDKEEVEDLLLVYNIAYKQIERLNSHGD